MLVETLFTPRLDEAAALARQAARMIVARHRLSSV
jgi:hypothetical protein